MIDEWRHLRNSCPVIFRILDIAEQDFDYMLLLQWGNAQIDITNLKKKNIINTDKYIGKMGNPINSEEQSIIFQLFIHITCLISLCFFNKQLCLSVVWLTYFDSDRIYERCFNTNENHFNKKIKIHIFHFYSFSR